MRESPHRLRNLFRTGSAALLFLLSSCSLIEEDMGECPEGYYLSFRYDYNMSFSDAFAQEVGCLAVYVFDSTGNYAGTFYEEGTPLKKDGYRMQLPLSGGKYDIIVWAGLDGHSFGAAGLQPGVSTLGDLSVKIKHDALGEVPHRNALHPLWHGQLREVSVPESGETRTDTVSLLRDTKTVRIMLQQVNGEKLRSEDYGISIASATGNGWMRCDNSLIPGRALTYRPYYNGEATVGGDGQGGGKVSLVIGELSTARLIAAGDLRLRILHFPDRTTVIDIPLAAYLLLTHMEGEKRIQSGQEYLDRQNEYALTFFLTAGGNWADTQIIINGWVLHLENTDL